MAPTGSQPRKEKKGKKSQHEARGASNSADASDGSEIPELVRSQVGDKKYLDMSLPPMHKLEDIFQDLAAKAMILGFADVLRRLGGRPLRVATVCSGTESPLLGLEMIEKGLGTGQRFRISHIFSCEIVPFKQAYIERNFGPPLLFRDLLELGGTQARTAYGSLELIPGDLDVMIAGTACVDFSLLNDKRKTLEESGESGSTFHALLEYAARYRPRLVIMENVRGAPWAKFAECWKKIEYDAFELHIDSKKYYIPQTRIRGYMVCVDKRLLKNDAGDKSLGRRVSGLVEAFARKASSPAGMFLLGEDDRRLEQIVKDLSTRLDANSSRAEISWERCKVRHEKHRRTNEVGDQRPISRSQGGGLNCQPPDFYWRPYFTAQVERVWETLDIKYLINMTRGVDMNFKERWVDLSQGVDRGNESEKNFGVAGCLTPCGMPFVTTRGGALSGIEALSLQGLPLDRMMLTRESQRDLQDLAGNAMTSTAVCAVILAALIANYDVLDQGAEPTDAQADADQTASFTLEEGDNLLPVSTEVSMRGFEDHDNLLLDATNSARYCVCEKQSGKKMDLVKCTQCEHTACSSCAGNPTHSYQPKAIPRTNPLEFMGFLKGNLPMRLVFEGLSETAFEEYRNLFPGDKEAKPSDEYIEYSETVRAALSDQVRFFDILRAERWTVLYEGEHCSLHLSITPHGIQWFVYGKPPRTSPARCLLREILAKPIARMTATPGSLLDGEWETCAPLSTRFWLDISGFGEQVKSYQARCGLLQAEFANSKVWTQILVEAEDADVLNHDVDVRGQYDYLPDCGTALGALYRKPGTTTSPAVYLFLDPSKYGDIRQDSCVFSLEHRRISGYAARMTIAELSPVWRPLHVKESPEKVSAFYRSWRKVPNASLKPYAAEQVVYRTLAADTLVSVGESNCHQSYLTLASLTAPAPTLNLSQVATPWRALGPGISTTLKDLAWAVQKVAAWSDFREWTEIAVTGDMPRSQETSCSICQPAPPRLLWGRDRKARIVPYEDPKGAATYERAMKSKPSPFMVFSRVGDDGLGELRFALNVQSLAHQAFGRLVDPRNAEDVSFTWRLISNAYDLGRESPGRFDLSHNRGDTPGAQPPNFKRHLREEQLRSLTWMVEQEAEDIAPFIEQETEEATLPLMSWRAEVKVTMPRTVRGGVLADEVGYGKTAIILGLVDAQSENDKRIFQSKPKEPGFIATNATLIIVPGNIFDQWASEIAKFLGSNYSILSIVNTAKLAKTEVKEFLQADIILVSWTLVKSDAYYKTMRSFTGTPRVPTQGGRNFDRWFDDAQQSLRQLVQVLETKGPEAFLEDVQERRRRLKETQEDSTYVPSRRLRGKVFALAQQQLKESDGTGTSQDQASSPSQNQIIPSSPELLRPYEATPGGRSDSMVSREASVFDRAGSRAARDESVFTRSTSMDTREASEVAQAESVARPEKMDLDAESHIQQYSDSEFVITESSDEESDEESDEDQCGKRKRGEENAQAGQAPRKARSTTGKKKWDDRKQFNILKGAQLSDLPNMKNPPLHAFSFNRLVIDEYTYAGEERQVSLLALSARCKWILSGTPAIDDFADIKSIARYLGVHLGIDDDGDVPTQNSRLKTIRKNFTAVEAFQMYQPPRSDEWYKHRRDHAQNFLDRFARQNIAMIDRIETTTHAILSKQFAGERDTYEALYDHLVSHNGRVHRIKNPRDDLQISRLNEFLGEKSQSSPQIALLKCSIAADLRDFAWDVESCKAKLATQNSFLTEAWDKLDSLAKQVAFAEHRWGVDATVWSEFSITVFANEFGDLQTTEDAKERMKEIFDSYQDWIKTHDKSDVAGKVAERFNKAKAVKALNAATESTLTSTGDASAASESEDASDKGDKDMPPPKRLKNSRAAVKREPEASRRAKERNVVKKLVDDVVASVQGIVKVVRDIRFFKAMQGIQTEMMHYCQGCPDYFEDKTGVVIVRSCGHVLCEGCIDASCEEEKCWVKGCDGSTKPSMLLYGRSLDNAGGAGDSSKLTALIEVIQQTSAEDLVILFVQFPDIVSIVSRALKSVNIEHRTAKPGNTSAISEFIQPKNQKGRGKSKTKDRMPRPKVLILHLGSSMAAGLNLQCANHVIFLTPLHATTQHEYESGMTQAIGRARRFGQKKHVHVYHLLAENTADVSIFQERNQNRLVMRDGEPFVVNKEDKPFPTDVPYKGPILNFDQG